MPLHYHISPDEGLITVHGHGEVSLQEIAQLGRDMLSDADYDPELPQLLDFRGLRPVIEGHLDELLAFLHGPYRDAVTSNVAVVIDEHLEDEHCADIFRLTCAIHEAELFSEHDLALRWLMRHAFAGLHLPQHPYAGRDHAHSAPE